MREVMAALDACRGLFVPVSDACLKHKMQRCHPPVVLSPEDFTIKKLQNLYEAIQDVHFDRRDFHNKMKRLEMLEQMDETVNPSQKKEAFLFRFNKAKYEELKQKGFRLEC